MKRTCG